MPAQLRFDMLRQSLTSGRKSTSGSKGASDTVNDHVNQPLFGPTWSGTLKEQMLVRRVRECYSGCHCA